jgi:hypothetical protein
MDTPISTDRVGRVKGIVVNRRPVSPDVLTGRLIISRSSAKTVVGKAHGIAVLNRNEETMKKRMNLS